ncbi:MAG: hypothetical protein U0R76_13375 [Candidatus Nanopelagicales bacterium]
MGDIHFPSRRDRVITSTVNAGAAIVLYVITSLLLGMVVIFLFARDSIGLASGARVDGDIMKQATAAADASVPAWASFGVLVLSALVAWLGSTRFGRGMIGDPAGSLKALGPDGERVTAGRTLLRGGVPVLLAVVGISLGLGPTVVVVLLVCAGIAAYREDRRGPFELLAKVHLVSTDAVKVDRETRREQLRATRTPAPADE